MPRIRESEPALFVTAGVLVLFFGVAFLLKYAVDRGLIPIEARLASAALGGTALLVLGVRARAARPGFGLALQGGGVGILLLVVGYLAPVPPGKGLERDGSPVL